MSTLDQLRHNLNRAWQNVAEGWRELREHAAQALTHFHPLQRGAGSVEQHDFLVERNASRWSLLAADILENPDEIVVKLEAPGMEPSGFDIQVLNDLLVVRGEKRVRRENRDGRYHLLECAYGAFERAIPLPAAVDADRTAARYEHGVLRITLAKLKVHQPTRINVRVD